MFQIQQKHQDRASSEALKARVWTTGVVVQHRLGKGKACSEEE
jgi:anthranilate phosphoribosyltransferase